MSTAGAAWALAHLSDPHVSTPLPPRGRERLGKRTLGHLAWRRRRRHVHRRTVLDELVADLHAQAPAHIAVSGDLTHLGQVQEYVQAADWLATLGPPERVSVVPGNHDAYVRGAWEAGVAHLDAYLSGRFPWRRRLGALTLIGVSSALPTGPASAGGRVGQAQLEALEGLLRTAAGTLRVVVLHHPPLAGAVRARKALADAPALRAALAAAGVELVLHGHGHLRFAGWLETRSGAARVCGVPSASSAETGPGRQAAYDLYRVTPAGDGCEVLRATRMRSPAGWTWAGEERLRFTLSAGGAGA